MRVRIAMLLVRLACRVLEGRDDRVVLLNTKRQRARTGPDAGKVGAFIVAEEDHKAAVSFPPKTAPKSLGTPVPVRVARLAGYHLYPLP